MTLPFMKVEYVATHTSQDNGLLMHTSNVISHILALTNSSPITWITCAFPFYRGESDSTATGYQVAIVYRIRECCAVTCESFTTSCSVDPWKRWFSTCIHMRCSRFEVSYSHYHAYARFSPFELSVADMECFVNHESTRKFLVLKLNMSQQVCPFCSGANFSWVASLLL